MEATESSPPPVVPPALPVAPVDKVCEFPDRISPMLVKELRQGLRTYTFATVFLTLQGVLTIVLLIAGSIAISANATGAGQVVSKIVFCFYALAVLVIQPLRGISSLSSEISRNTIDLMVLTRLSAWRIVWGKWSCLMSQSLLIALAVLPYLIFRYFFGGMQLFSELFLLVYVLVVSATLTAVTIGLSALGSGLLRGLAVVCGGGFLAIFVLFQFTPNLETYISALSLASLDRFFLSLGLLVLAAYLAYFFLELGTSFIAPAAENRATRKRLVGLVVAILAFVAVQPYSVVAAVVAAGAVGALLFFDAFSEKPEFPGSVTRPFLRWGAPGRLGGRIFYPGWPTASLFFLLFAGVLALLTLATSAIRGHDAAVWTTLGIVLGVIIFPAAVIQLIARRSAHRHSNYLAIAGLAWLLTFVLVILYDVVSEDLLFWVFSPLPMVQGPLAGSLWDSANRQILVLLPWVVTAAYWLVVMLGSLSALRKLGALEEEELSEEGNDDQ